ncbi:hypothetical protein KCP73_00565 [Salmonella enterica subsp. enterica]|nr:hypothetical protein KCP73_00565 [Salmonella enterica subsp. enterica]
MANAGFGVEASSCAINRIGFTGDGSRRYAHVIRRSSVQRRKCALVFIIVLSLCADHWYDQFSRPFFSVVGGVRKSASPKVRFLCCWLLPVKSLPSAPVHAGNCSLFTAPLRFARPGSG